MTVNWWLVTLAFVLGLVITLGFTVRRVETGDDSDTARVTDEPYGEGSVRLPVASADGPSGYPVKGNEDSMLYHSPESPTYERTIAEVWFRDVRTAEAAGFNRWDSGKSQRGK
jgi:uncharacterized membrane protein ArfC